MLTVIFFILFSWKKLFVIFLFFYFGRYSQRRPLVPFEMKSFSFGLLFLLFLLSSFYFDKLSDSSVIKRCGQSFPIWNEKKRENSSFIYFARVFKSSNLKNDDKSKCFPDDSLSSRPTFFKCRFPVCFSRLLFPSVVNPRTAFLAVGWLRIVAITSRRSNKNSTIVFSSLLSVCLSVAISDSPGVWRPKGDSSPFCNNNIITFENETVWDSANVNTCKWKELSKSIISTPVFAYTEVETIVVIGGGGGCC